MEANKRYQIDEYYIELQKKAQSLDIINKKDTIKKPFPGLRPFTTAEAHLFFGREGLSNEVLKLLVMESNFLAILGASGSGKSSLIRAGLIPNLHSGKLQEENTNWRIVICRPGNNPIGNLAAALACTKFKDRLDKTDELNHEIESIHKILKESSYGILEVLDSFNDIYEKTLIVVDQFEELFRFGDNNPENKINNERFVDLLLTASKLEDSTIYTIITMRSEFLGECVKFRNLPEAINKGQYLVPRLSTKNIADTIEGPLAVVGKGISLSLVNHMVNEIGDDMDQLPVLQHALMRTYNFALSNDTEKEKLAFDDYKEIGTMGKALSNHATAIFNALKSESARGEGLSRKQKIAKLIFQRLTDESKGSLGGRYPTPVRKLYAIAKAKPLKASKKEVNEVINAFRGADTSFLMPPIGTKLRDDLVIDISHESLMRNWDLLIGSGKEIGWIREEVENGKRYKQLHERRQQGDFIVSSLLDDLLEWESKNCISAAWAKRYSGKGTSTRDFKKNIDFIHKSDTHRKDLIEKETNEAIKKVKFQKNLIKVGLITVVILIILLGWGFRQKKIADSQRILAIFKTLKRSNPTLSYNSATKWQDYTGKNPKGDFKSFIDSFDTRNTYLINTLPLSSSLVSIDFSNENSGRDLESTQGNRKIKVIEFNSSSIWDINNGILKSKKLDSIEYGYPDRKLRKIIFNKKEYSVIQNDRDLIIKNDKGDEVSKFNTRYNPRNIQISNNGKYIVVDNKVFDFATKKAVANIYQRNTKTDSAAKSNFKFIPSSLRVSKVVFFNDDKHIAVGYRSGLIQIINFNPESDKKEGKLIAAFKRPESGSITSLALDSNHKYLFAGTSDYTLDIWKINVLNDSISKDSIIKNNFKEYPYSTLIGHTGSINCLSVSPDNKYVLSGSDDNLAILWNIQENRLASILRGTEFPVKYVGFSDSGKEIFTSDLSTRFSIWKSDFPEKIDNLIKISPFHLYNRGIEKVGNREIDAYDIYNIKKNDNLNVEKMSGDVLHYILSIPKKNLYPEDRKYFEGMTKSLKEVHLMFTSLIEMPAFKSIVSQAFRDLLFKEHMDLELRKDDLLFKTNSVSKSVKHSILLVESIEFNFQDSIQDLKKGLGNAELLVKLAKELKEKNSSQSKINMDMAEKYSYTIFPVLLNDSIRLEKIWRDVFSHYCNSSNQDDADAMAKNIKQWYQKDSVALGKLWLQFYNNYSVGSANRIASFKMSDRIIDKDTFLKNKQSYLDNYSFWWERSWNALFVNKPKEAIIAANKSLDFESKKTLVITNLVLGYVLSDQWDKAKSVYLEWKDKSFYPGNKISNESFLKDLIDLEKAGVHHPDFEKVRKLFEPESSLKAKEIAVKN